MMTSTGYEPLDIRCFRKDNGKECWLCSDENHTEGTGILGRVLDILEKDALTPVSIRLFGNRTALAEAAAFLKTEADWVDCPPVQIVQEHLTMLQVQVYAVSSAALSPLRLNGSVIGHTFEDRCAAYYLFRVLPDPTADNAYDHTRSIFDQAQAMMESVGGGFQDTLRTWLFADDILSWYDQLNAARNRFFEDHGIYQRLVPASTGIGVGNRHNCRLAAQVLAVRSKNPAVQIAAAESPLQCSALDYKSSFSRAVKLSTPDYSKLYVSGTASIDGDGRTVFLDDTPAQVDWTMQVVEAILRHAQMEWADTTNALVYFKDRRDFKIFDDYCLRKNIRLPHIKVEAFVCRHDLLFEIELEALRPACPNA